MEKVAAAKCTGGFYEYGVLRCVLRMEYGVQIIMPDTVSEHAHRMPTYSAYNVLTLDCCFQIPSLLLR